MIPKFDKIHNRFKLNEYHFAQDDLKEVAYSYIKEGLPYEKKVGDFINNWMDDSPLITIQSSGSTGAPKEFHVEKQAMVNSAISTGDFFKLKPGDSALHCLPINFIAGEMMLVRGLILGLELDVVEPKSKIVLAKDYDFAAMTPMQLENSLDTIEHVKILIVGGAPISKELVAKIQHISTRVYMTYGMAETLSHIGLKKLNHTTKKNAPYRTLPKITVSKDDRGCLVINAPRLSQEPIVTNDLVEIYSETEFDWLGRVDNVINSGGIKLLPELMEAKIQDQMDRRFFFASQPDPTLGEKVILVVEGDSNVVEPKVFEALDTYEKPKAIYSIPQFEETSSGKVRREETLTKLLKM
ncbi:AMP-binding protein [Mangrovimonas sp. CR14]|uniref:AMP-binding protein n=1 Tax=Mangrovimonas sp. CR14 TaxID=2706120 RepID=UPI00141D934C|nr:AMP-binding protein [Mangrovimonas sp. CR14]NIK91989.1 AMP-binding protein [Mangrovimonas sp. CR14]